MHILEPLRTSKKKGNDYMNDALTGQKKLDFYN